MKTLEEEIAYLNKHYEVEMGMMKDEIEILKKQLNQAIRRKDVDRNHTPQSIQKGNLLASPQLLKGKYIETIQHINNHE